MTIHYFDLCSSLSFVTHGADSTPISNGDSDPTSRDGYVIHPLLGYSATDRDTGNPSNLASIWYVLNSTPDPGILAIDFAAGDYKIGCALGDFSSAQGAQKMVVKDGSTVLLTVTGNQSSANEFIDASGTLLTAANWKANQTPQTVTLAGTTLTFEFGVGSGSGITCASCLSIELVTAPPPPVTSTPAPIGGLGPFWADW